jgi:predicted DCC family thiol-disulfide oxidoreductase YuxK
MPPELSRTTVYFDGSCPLCRAEIGYYRRKDQTGNLCFVDVSETGAATPAGIIQQQVMARFHVRASNGRVLSGATAFVEVWERLPHWRWAARVASVPGVLAVLELGYGIFLPIRPYISRFIKRVSKQDVKPNLQQQANTEEANAGCENSISMAGSDRCAACRAASFGVHSAFSPAPQTLTPLNGRA